MLARDLKTKDEITPRPLLDNLEEIAIAIHESYNQKQLERFPDQPLKYPRFSDLPYSLKYSRQMYVVYDLGAIRDEDEFKSGLENKEDIIVIVIKQ